jgi:DNA mismatch repair protein MutS
MDAVEYADRIVFLHQVKAGPASQSYGLQVAALAGVPRAVIDDARSVLQRLERQACERDINNTTPPQQIDLFVAKDADRLVDALRAIDPDRLSPRDALDALYKLRSLIA